MPEHQEREVKRGFWHYDGLLRKGILIQAINYDYWYELEQEEGVDQTGETPQLNAQGEMYMLLWMDQTFTTRESFTVGGLDLAETLALAESIVRQPIEWLVTE
ncbi:hypothetical protein [Hymenobacter cavernae]|uniref:Uncharacterized protein n=1 Tax=Hymenobacter cavernae TaxID=2044852 RepID=A0ABQ1U3E3_9BACT|nr:hypothetical protein [Hymenobacter cavernae]GGF09810.1 hypothetical protein GCM10011383_21270 [Hymenobacter cavernae]